METPSLNNLSMIETESGAFFIKRCCVADSVILAGAVVWSSAALRAASTTKTERDVGYAGSADFPSRWRLCWSCCYCCCYAGYAIAAAVAAVAVAVLLVFMFVFTVFA